MHIPKASTLLEADLKCIRDTKKVRSVSAKKERKRAMQTSITEQGYLLNSVGLK